MEEEIEVDYEDFEEQPEQPPEASIDEDVYGDLFDDEGEKGALLKAKHATLQEECKELQDTIARLRQEVETITGEKSALQEERQILVRNISCIYRTAKEELDRTNEAMKEKDRIIHDLQTALHQSQGHAVPPPPSVGLQSS